MVDVNNLTCQTCGNVGLYDGFDGFFYCCQCRDVCDDLLDTCVGDVPSEGGETGGGTLYTARHSRRLPEVIKSQSNDANNIKSTDAVKIEPTDVNNIEPADAIKIEPISQYNSYKSLFDGTNPAIPEDFGGSNVATFEGYLNQIRLRYVMGLQMMIELQCEALVKEFKVTPLICGLVGPIWLRFVSKTGVFDDDWADKQIYDSEMREEGDPEDYKPRAQFREEPYNLFGRRVVMIWFRSLKKTIPVAYTIVVSYLACHIAREAILPSDILKWAREGKLPYFSAFVEIERRMKHPSIACPISSSVMFRPQQAISVPKLESFAASIAQLIGLELPPVNFYAIAYRYLEKLSLPVEKIIPYACRIYEWSMPPDLWLSLSTDYFRLPTHVCVVSILVVAIRILYNINGSGEWEKSLSHNNGTEDKIKMDSTFASHDTHGFGANDPAGTQKHKLDSAGLLQHLQAKYNEFADTHEYSKDLPTYLKYCRDVVFAGLEPSYGNHEEEKMIENLWNFFQNEKNSKPSKTTEQFNTSLNETRLRGEGCISRATKENMGRECSNEPSLDDDPYLANDSPRNLSNDNSSESSLQGGGGSNSNEQCSGNSDVKEAIRQMKLDMEENRFCYIPPSIKPTKVNYVHYSRKKDEGALTYAAHADYYILLRAFARIAQVDIRILNLGVLSLERRLAWLEKRIHKCVHLKPPNISCQFCCVKATENGSEDIY